MANTDAKPGTYHHGDLRSALLAAAVEEISRVGVNNLSMRELARRAGVSHAAPAYHFGDKTGLLTALAAEGFRILHEHTTPKLGRADALVRAGEAYVEFALAQPAHFAVMFDPHLLRMDDPVLDAERGIAFANLFAAVQETTGTQDAAQVTREAIAAWAVVHGTAVLWLQGNLPYLTDAGSVGEVFAELGSGLKTVAIASAEHLERPTELHQHRDVAASFGSDAARYDRARPRYPDELVHRIVAASPGPDLLDVGCGIGIAARQFQAAGCRVLGVDVDARMAALARDFGIEVEVAPFESWDAAGRNFDAVIAAQAWHWVDPVAGAHKVAEVLRPGGRFAAFWNVFQPPADLAAAFGEVYQRLVPDSIVARPAQASPIAGYGALVGQAAEGLNTAGGFGDPEEWRFEWDRDYERDEWLDLVPTTGDASQWPAATLEAVLAGIGAAIDEAGGRLSVHFSVVVATAVRTG